MSQNLKLVIFFINEFYKNNSSEIVNLVSPTFSFTLNTIERQNFQQFVQRMRFLNQSCKFEIRTPRTHNDTHFYSEFSLNIPNGDSSFIEANGTVEMIVKNSLLQAVNIRYHNSQAEFVEIQKIMKKSQIAFL